VLAALNTRAPSAACDEDVRGPWLGAMHLRSGTVATSGWPLGASHGTLGVIGLILLLLALRGPPHGEAMGVGPFGRIAAVLIAMALLAGLAILVGRLRHCRVSSLIIGAHATIAVTGVVILAAYALLG
jgi:Ca2+/H+ antiporter